MICPALAIRKPAPPLGMWAQLYTFLLTVVPIVLTLIMAPIFPCRRCGPCPQLVGYTKLPGVTPAEAERMMTWGYSYPCGACNSSRRLSLLRAMDCGLCCD